MPALCIIPLFISPLASNIPPPAARRDAISHWARELSALQECYVGGLVCW